MSSESSGSALAVLKRFRPQRTQLRVSACVAASRSMRDPSDDVE